MPDAILKAADITKEFGGITALKDLSFAVQEGAIHAIIGPNGAGKTTLINVLSGFLPPDTGTISLNNQVITGQKSHDIAKLGIGRTFQNAEIFGNMSVLENVMVGRHTRTSAGLFSSALTLPRARREEKQIRDHALSCLETVGLLDLAAVAAASIPIGNQRLLEVARALASEPRVLLLDEPAAGLNTQETRMLAELIRSIQQRGITVIIVEHDMELVMDISDDILVINFGEKIAVGSPAEIQANPEVIAVYLGEEG